MTITQRLDHYLGDSVPVVTIIKLWAATMLVAVVVGLPFHSQLSQIAASTPSWLIHPSPSLERLVFVNVVEIVLVVLWCYLWINRPEGVFGR